MKISKALLFIFVIVSLLILSACGSDEDRSVDVAGMLVKDPPNLTIVEKEPEIGCKYDNPSCEEGHECLDNECVLKDGCDYDNPRCDENQTCSGNVCKLKSGCDYNNPACKNGLSCINNRCILAVGCNWDNPPCEKNFECYNNECVPSPGCANDDPPCPWGQACMYNKCIGTAVGNLGSPDRNNQWENLQTVEESGIDLGTQKD